MLIILYMFFMNFMVKLVEKLVSLLILRAKINEVIMPLGKLGNTYYLSQLSRFQILLLLLYIGNIILNFEVPNTILNL